MICADVLHSSGRIGCVKVLSAPEWSLEMQKAAQTAFVSYWYSLIKSTVSQNVKDFQQR